MTTALIDESALPTVTPTSAAVGDAATALRTSTAAVRSSAAEAQRSWSGIGTVLAAPGATDPLPDALRGATRTADSLAAAAGTVSAALETLADDVASIRRSRRGLLADIEELRIRVAASENDGAVPDEYRAVNDDLHTRARRLRSRWQTSQDEIAHVLLSQAGGRVALLATTPIVGTLAPPSTRIDFDGASRAFRDAGRLPLLAGLAAAGPDALRQWAAAHPGEAQRLLNHPPATAQVKAWWAALDPDERTALVTGLSTVVGNLGGVRYSDRGRANQHTLTTELPRAQARYRALSGKVARGQELSVAERAEYARLAQVVGALEALERTLLRGTAAAPRSIVSLTLGRPPLAAVAVGDLDTASNVTVNVPGMGNTVAGSMQAWTAGALNLRESQQMVARENGLDMNVATVAWIGYDTPEMPPSPDVLFSTKARRGAESLSGFLNGVSGTRGWAGGQHLSVVAHSYGTTTATLATAKAPVANLTLLASAGIDLNIADVHAVGVPPDHVWASQSRDDYVANIGRGSVELPGADIGGDQPLDTGNPFTSNRWRRVSLPSAHPFNPGDPRWGARTFTSNDEQIDGWLYPGSSGHGATPRAEASITGTTTTDIGYLDRGTSSLRNTSYTSLGFTPGGGKIP